MGKAASSFNMRRCEVPKPAADVAEMPDVATITAPGIIGPLLCKGVPPQRRIRGTVSPAGNTTTLMGK